jgi:hypothetical protein
MEISAIIFSNVTFALLPYSQTFGSAYGLQEFVSMELLSATSFAGILQLVQNI